MTKIRILVALFAVTAMSIQHFMKQGKQQRPLIEIPTTENVSITYDGQVLMMVEKVYDETVLVDLLKRKYPNAEVNLRLTSKKRPQAFLKELFLQKRSVSVQYVK